MSGGFVRVDGVAPAGGVNASPDPGLFLNFFYNTASTSVSFLPMRGETESGSPSGSRNFAIPDTGTIDVTAYLEPTVNLGSTICDVQVNAVSQGTDTLAVVTGTTSIFSITGVSVTAGDDFAVSFNPTTSNGSFRGVVRIVYQ